MATARRLFAERGVDAVSLREVVKEAGVRHATAVQYHFGDREGLLQAVLAEHAERVDTRRDAVLEQHAADGSADLRSLVGALVRPLAQELATEEGRLFLRVYAQLVVRTQERYTDSGTSIWRWREQIDPFLPPGTAPLHLRFTALTFVVVELSRRSVETPHADDRLFVSRLVDVAVAILSAPPSPESLRLLEERAARGPRA